MASKKLVKICPNCGSVNVTRKDGKDYCNDCKKSGNFPMIEKSKQNFFQKLLAAKG